MTITIGLVANVFNEIHALPGWLETHLPFFDDVRILHAGPGGSYSTDGTIELLEKWRVPVEFCAIDEGFGVVRTKAFRMSPCDYVMLLDADERFYSNTKCLAIDGEGTPQNEVDWILQSYDFRGVNLPNWENIGKLGSNLRVTVGSGYDQGQWIREKIEQRISQGNPIDAIVTSRRHWHDLGMKRPTQDWRQHPDWQQRFIRNDPSIKFDSSTRMHERLIGANNIEHADMGLGPFFDHFHFHFKRMEPQQRAHDVRIYDAIHEGRTPPTT